MTRRKDSAPLMPPPKPESPPTGEGLITSEDLFGDLIDAPPAPVVERPTRASPIRVQVSEPGVSKDAKRSGETLPPDVAALLDAFSEPGEAATRASAPEQPLDLLLGALGETNSVEPHPQKAPGPLEGEQNLNRLLDALEGPPPEASPPVEAVLPEPAAPSSEPGGGAALIEQDLELSRPEEAPKGALPQEASIAEPQEKEQKEEKKEISSRAEESVSEAPKETSAKVKVAPAKAVGGGLDLAAVAETALAQGRPPEPPSKVPAKEELYGPYRLLEKVAVGGMAEVFRAKRSGVEGFEKVVAVKRILPHLSQNKEFVDMFINEAKMVAGLTHPSIVQISDLGKIDKSYYIAMEYIHGRDLRSIQKRAKDKGLRLPLDLSVLIVSRVCASLEYAHRKKDDRGRAMLIVHRDISPQNILISFEGEVKLTDFGIAKAATKASTTDAGALRGKLLYMSPEQAWGRSMDRRSDIFSLGIVFYELVTDQRPFLGNSEMSILETVRECRVAPPTSLNPRVPEKLEGVIMKALHRNPEQRYQDATEMARDLERVLPERKPATGAELARFMELLFEPAERQELLVEEPPMADERHGGSLEIEFDSSPPESKTPTEKPEPSLHDPMSIQKLLKRFGIK
jgi:serine/threonine protein kinase